MRDLLDFTTYYLGGRVCIKECSMGHKEALFMLGDWLQSFSCGLWLGPRCFKLQRPQKDPTWLVPCQPWIRREVVSMYGTIDKDPPAHS
jgi:hypothetical protein